MNNSVYPLPDFVGNYDEKYYFRIFKVKKRIQSFRNREIIKRKELQMTLKMESGNGMNTNVLKDRQIIKAARVMSMIFTPFYLPLLGLVILFLFSYMSLLPLSYKLSVLLFYSLPFLFIFIENIKDGNLSILEEKNGVLSHISFLSSAISSASIS